MTSSLAVSPKMSNVGWWTTVKEKSASIATRVVKVAFDAIGKTAVGGSCLVLQWPLVKWVNGYLQQSGVDVRQATSQTSKIVNLAGGHYSVSRRLIEGSSCRLTAMAEQLSIQTGTTVTARALRGQIIGDVVLYAPLMEEFVFRGVIQGVVLRLAQQAIYRRMAPHCPDSRVDSLAAKITRVVLSAAIFAAAHTMNLSSMDSQFVTTQVAQSLVTGLVLGGIAETRLGLFGSFGLHALNNLLATYPVLSAC